MPNLIQRLTGATLPEDSNEKIAIHPFLGALNEYRRGKITGPDIISAFNLDTDQTNQAVALKDLIVAAPQKTEFMRVFKDLMYMGEYGLNSNYTDISWVNSRLEEEVTDQGGTLP